MEIIRQAADATCVSHLEKSIQTIDSIIERDDDPISRVMKNRLKSLFGLAELQHDEDFASLISVG